MSPEDKYNPNDPEFLASRGLDESLSDEQRKRLDESDSLRQVNEWVQSLRDEKLDLDWETFQQTIQDRITCEYDEAELDRVDSLIHSATELPNTWEQRSFTSGVLEQIKPNANPRHARLWWMKAVMPLAAAAAIALVVTMSSWQQRSNEPTFVVDIGPANYSNSHPSLKNAVADVSFRREPITRQSQDSRRSHVSFVTVGAESINRYMNTAPPL